MLVLTRKLDESITIGDNINITILDIKKDCVRIGINAPRNVKIFRQEVFEQIQNENIASSRVEKKAIEKIFEILD